MTEDEKRLTDRARVIQSFIDEERARIVALIGAIDSREFLLYAIDNSYTTVEIDRALFCFNADKPVDDIEDLM